MKNNVAIVDYGRLGQRNNVNVSMIKVQPGDYVLVQGGFAIQVLDEKEALKILEVWNAIQQDVLDAQEMI